MQRAVLDSTLPDAALPDLDHAPDDGAPDDGPLSLRWRYTSGSRIEAASAGLCAFLGWPGCAPDTGLSDILHPDDCPGFVAEVAEALRCGHDRARHVDHRVVGADGRVAWWQTVTLFRPMPDGGVRCVSHAFDITGLRSDPPPTESVAGPVAAPVADERTLLQALIDSIPDLIFVKDPGSVYLGCNQAFADFMGRPVDAIVGHTDFDLVPADRAMFFRERDVDIVRLRQPHRMEETVCWPDGRDVLLETIKTPYYGPSGTVLGLVAVARDITEKASTQRELHESERRLATLLGNLPGMAYRCRPDTVRSMLFVSGGGHRLTGYRPTDLTDGALFYGDLIHPDDRARVVAGVQEALDRRRRFTLSYRLVDRAGVVRHVWEQGVGVAEADGRLMAVEGFITDITELKTAEETLRTLSLAVAQSPVAVVITDALGKTVYLNPRFRAMTGRTLDAVPDLDAFVLSIAATGGEAAAEHTRVLWRTLSAGGTWQAELPARHADGRHFWAAITVAPVLDDDGRITNVIGTADDITGRRQAEEQVRRAQKMQAVGVLAGGIAHDFNNILTAILGYSHLALDALPGDGDSEIRDDLAQVTSAANRAKGLVQQLLTFSRKEKLGRELADLRDSVREALQLVQPTVPSGIRLEFRCDDEALPVLAAATQIHQVVMNLCKNAIDAIQGDATQGNTIQGDPTADMKRQGTVTVTLAPLAVAVPRQLGRARLETGRYAGLTVVDNGCGMSAVTLERIFEPFFTTKPVDRGTGLGLAAVHGIVAEHGGVIDVNSVPGGGSAFSIYLPLHDPGKPYRSGCCNGRRVMLLDSERTMLGMAGRLLRSQGFHVVASADSRRGLALFSIAPERFDAVVLAQSMAAQTWKLLTLARAFAAAAPGIPIVVCADAAIEREGAAIEAAGVTRILHTPIVPDQFVTLVERLAAERYDQTRP